MNQEPTLNNPSVIAQSGYPMKKSDIVIAIIALRSGVSPPAKKVLRELSSALKRRSTHLKDWDHPIDATYSQRIINHIRSVRGMITMQGVVSDIDILVTRRASIAAPCRVV